MTAETRMKTLYTWSYLPYSDIPPYRKTDHYQGENKDFYFIKLKKGFEFPLFTNLEHFDGTILSKYLIVRHNPYWILIQKSDPHDINAF